VDIAIAPNKRGEMEAHRPDCPVVRRLADQGVPVMTMFDLARPLTRQDIPWHSCLDVAADGPASTG
jgi:hypothetical protein